jgi:hypothetical protein
MSEDRKRSEHIGELYLKLWGLNLNFDSPKFSFPPYVFVRRVPTSM